MLPPPVRTPDVQTGPIVLVVDDIESARIVCERRLRQAGYRVIAVANAGAALEALLQVPAVAAVIADWNLAPWGNGLALLEQIGRRRGRVARILWPADPAGCDAARAAGVRCVEKTGHYTELLAVLAEELGRG